MKVEEGEGEWTVARPPTPFIDESGESKGWNELLNHKGWNFRSQQRKPIAEDARDELRRLVEAPRGVPLPEIAWGHNYLQMIFPEMGLDFAFNTVDALRSWNELQHELCMSESGKVDETNYDRRYANAYTGTMHADEVIKRQVMRREKLIEAPYFAVPVRTHKKIPLEQLKKRGHIYFFDEVPLYEDSMGGKGMVQCFVKLRVMEDCFLLLYRQYLRINGKQVQLKDTRWFHSFGDSFILMDTEIRRASVEELASRSEAHRPFSASIDDKAKRDERFYLLPDQVYDILDPIRTERNIMSISLL